MKPTVLIMSGASGAGKSTLAAHLTKEATLCDLTSTIVSADHYFETPSGYEFNPCLLPRAHQKCFIRFLVAVDLSTPTPYLDLVIVDNTNTSTWEISPYVLAGEAARFHVTILRLDTPLDVCQHLTTHNTPNKIIEAQHKRFADNTLPWWDVRTINPHNTTHPRTLLQNLLLS